MLGITFLFNIFFVLHFVTSFHQNESFMEKHKKMLCLKKNFGFIFTRVHGSCLNVSPNSYGAHGVYTNATHLEDLEGCLRWPPPLLPSTSYGGPRLDDLGDAHARSYGQGPHKFHLSKVQEQTYLWGSCHMRQQLKICDVISTILGEF